MSLVRACALVGLYDITMSFIAPNASLAICIFASMMALCAAWDRKTIT